MYVKVVTMLKEMKNCGSSLVVVASSLIAFVKLVLQSLETHENVLNALTMESKSKMDYRLKPLFILIVLFTAFCKAMGVLICPYFLLTLEHMYSNKPLMEGLSWFSE